MIKLCRDCCEFLIIIEGSINKKCVKCSKVNKVEKMRLIGKFNNMEETQNAIRYLKLPKDKRKELPYLRLDGLEKDWDVDFQTFKKKD